MNQHSVIESIVIAVVFITVFGMKHLGSVAQAAPIDVENPSDHQAQVSMLAESASGMQLQLGPMNLVVQVANGQ